MSATQGSGTQQFFAACGIRIHRHYAYRDKRSWDLTSNLLEWRWRTIGPVGACEGHGASWPRPLPLKELVKDTNWLETCYARLGLQWRKCFLQTIVTKLVKRLFQGQRMRRNVFWK